MGKKGISVDQAIADMKKRREKAVKEAILMVEADSKLLVRRKTGNLARSLTHEVVSDDNKTVGAVGSNVEYAGIEEYRTGFLEQSVDMNIENIRLKIEDVLKNG